MGNEIGGVGSFSLTCSLEAKVRLSNRKSMRGSQPTNADIQKIPRLPNDSSYRGIPRTPQAFLLTEFRQVELRKRYVLTEKSSN